MTARRAVSPKTSKREQPKPKPKARPKPVLSMSYFVRIERIYGRPLAEWMALVDEQLEAGKKHAEAVAWLRANHRVSNNHANGLVAFGRNVRRLRAAQLRECEEAGTPGRA